MVRRLDLTQSYLAMLDTEQEGRVEYGSYGWVSCVLYCTAPVLQGPAGVASVGPPGSTSFNSAE